MLKITFENIPLLSDYLHDAFFNPQDFTYDKNSQQLTILLARVYYEKPYFKKKLFFIPMIRYKKINCKLVIKHIENMETHYLKGNSSKDDYCLLRIDFDDENKRFTIAAEYMTMNAYLTNNSEISMEDISEPSEKFYTSDCFAKKPWFKIEEINKLKINT